MPLSIISTPIGNRQDMTLRAIMELKKADLILCEDTRRTSQLLAFFNIKKPLWSYHDHNEEKQTMAVIPILRQGKSVCLVSDAGTPLIHDPGYRIVAACIKEGIPIIPITGASAVLAALVASGASPSQFQFLGFLPKKGKERREMLSAIKDASMTSITYESPYRMKTTLADLDAIMPLRKICLCREMTKVHEEFLRGTAAEILEIIDKRTVKGECVLVIDKEQRKDIRIGE